MDTTDDRNTGQPDWEELDRYLAGQLSPNQADQIQRYLDDRAGAETTLKTLGDVYPKVQGDEPSVAVAWQTMQARMMQILSETQARRPSSLIRHPWWYTAAGLLAGVVVIIAGWGTGLIAPRLAPSPEISVYTTGNGQRATVTLSDGTQVYLNVASRLEVPVDYGRGNRTLRLVGEALFTVTHRDHAPFVVIAGPSTTRVLGTTFLVRHYPSDTAALVAVRDGKVVVRDSVLTAMQQIAVSDVSLHAIHTANAAQFEFVSGRLQLDSVSLPTAILALNRWYDVEIRLGDLSLAERNVTGGFHAGSIADLVTMLEWTYDLRVVRDGRVLTLYPKE